MESTTPVVRRDASRTRALLLAAADAVIRESGMDLSLNAVARHAGVGVGTVYRHFPDRAALITAMFEERTERLLAIMCAHLDDEDPVLGLRAAVYDICRMQVHDRGAWEVASAGASDPNSERAKARLLPVARKLIRRANASGRLRVRFETTDMLVMLWTGGALNTYLGGLSSDVWWRYVQLLFDSYLSDDDPARTPIEQKALSVDQIDAAVRAWHPA